MTARTILELPFVERAPLDLLGFDGDRDTVDLDYAGFGWARIDRVWLDDGATRVAVDDALVLALHAADDGEVLADDVELEFADDGGAVTVLCSTFLDRWLPRLPATDAIVLALCNPHRARLAARPRPIHYGLGAVDAWHDVAADRLRLTAERWLRAEEPTR